MGFETGRREKKNRGIEFNMRIKPEKGWNLKIQQRISAERDEYHFWKVGEIVENVWETE